ncbi:MAG: hypothetical protein MJ245_06395 [Clostridia bacterium]|nr:hypothetical protein [Clostridia bacterium]
MNKYLIKNKTSNDNLITSMKKIFKIISFTFVFVFLLSISSFSTSYARTKYTFTTKGGGDYIIIADVNDDGSFAIVNKCNGINSTSVASTSGGDSLYKTVADDYKNAFRTSTKNTNTKNRGTDIANLLELFVKSQKKDEGNYYLAEIKYKAGTDDEKIIINGSGNTAAYGKSGNKSYKDIITEMSNDSKNPYYNEYKDSEKYITYIDKPLDEFFDDSELIKAYENYPNKSQLSWIKKEETTEGVAQADYSYSLLLDKDSDPERILARVKDSDGNIATTFLIAKFDGDTYVERGYSNGTSGICWQTQNKYKIALSGTYDDTLILYFEEYGDSFYNFTKTFGLSDNHLSFESPRFIATRDTSSNSIRFYYVTGTNEQNNEGHFIGTLPLDLSNISGQSFECDNWLLDYTSEEIQIYPRDFEVTTVYDYMYHVHLNDAYLCFNDNKYTYDVAIPVSYGNEGTYNKKITKNPGSFVAFISTDKQLNKDYDNNYDAIERFEADLDDPSVKMYITIYKGTAELKYTGTSKTEDVLKLNQLVSKNTDNTLPPKLSIKSVIANKSESSTQGTTGNRNARTALTSAIENSRGGVISNKIYDGVISEKFDISIEIVNNFVTYGRIILILLIFIAIIIAGFKHMISSAQDPAERAKTIDTFKRLVAGIIVFIILAGIVVLIMDYLDKGMAFFGTYVEEFGQGDFLEDDKIAEQSPLLEVIEIIIRAANEITAGIIEILMKQLAGNGEQLDYMGVIYDVYTADGAVSAFKPFDDEGIEWTRVMSGYNVMVSISFLMLLVAFVKSAIDYVVFAGNEKKLVEVKELWERIFWAVLLILAMPYLIRALIYLFNYMVAAVPVNYQDNKYDLVIEFEGVLGALANNIWLTTRLNIFFSFLVRHIMLDVLVVSGPIVVGIWAISKKFKSFPLWFGELITNVAMQFCYAVGFLILILLSFEGESPLYGLILVSVAVALSKFVKESLQGYFASGAGINEEKEGSAVVKRVFGWKKKAVKKFKAFGKDMSKAAKKVDKTLSSKSARAFYNVGNIMSGNLKNMKFVGKPKNLAGAEKNIQRQINDIKDDDEREEAQNYFDDIKNGNGVAQTMEGGVYDSINAYNAYKNSGDIIGGIRDNIQNKTRAKAIKKATGYSKEFNHGNGVWGEDVDIDDRIEDSYGLSNEEKEELKHEEEKEQAIEELDNETEEQRFERIDSSQKELSDAKMALDSIADDMMAQDIAGETARQEALTNAAQSIKDAATIEAYFGEGFNEEVIGELMKEYSEKQANQLKHTNIKVDAHQVYELMNAQLRDNASRIKGAKDRREIAKTANNNNKFK